MKSISLTDVASFFHIKLATNDVLQDSTQKNNRRHSLQRAMRLHYESHLPVNIFFKDHDNKLFSMECDVIAVTDDHVMLKSGLIISVKSIVLIELL